MIKKSQTRLKLEESGRVFMIWPQTVCHFIDQSSPFYGVTQEEMEERRFELVVAVKGESGFSGHTTQAKTSFLSHEILINHRFINMISYDGENCRFHADIDKMDEVEATSDIC